MHIHVCMYVCTYACTDVHIVCMYHVSRLWSHIPTQRCGNTPPHPLGIGLGGNTPLQGSGGGQYHRGDKEHATRLYTCIYLNSSRYIIYNIENYTNTYTVNVDMCFSYNQMCICLYVPYLSVWRKHVRTPSLTRGVIKDHSWKPQRTCPTTCSYHGLKKRSQVTWLNFKNLCILILANWLWD